jgi:hypothetical protein
MKVTLEFDSSEGAVMALKASQMQILIFNLDNHLREKIKYGNFSEIELNIYQNTRDWLHSEINDLNLRELLV